MGKMIIVSNRLPVRVEKQDKDLLYMSSSGGLATGVGSYYQSQDGIWVGWPGYFTTSKVEKQKIRDNFKKQHMSPVFLSKNQIEKYYEGFSNKTIWPLFHYFAQYTVYHQELWDAYRYVNKLFCNEIADKVSTDDIIWIHDYQLMLLPELIRQKNPRTSIGFFLHIPFPSFEIFRTLPWRKEILHGILGADLIGFHTYDYARHFLSAATRLLGIERTFNRLNYDDRIIRVDAFPMGIDYEKYAVKNSVPEIDKELKKYYKSLSSCKILLSIDRLDYSKAIPQRLKCFDLFLERNPQYRGKITLIIVVVPSRSSVKHYQLLKKEVDNLVGQIEGKYSSINYSPVHFMYRALEFEELVALYKIADIALVTPFRDGMNLIAKEYVASKTEKDGVLILSEMAGAAVELGDALLINPNDINEMVTAIETALVMPPEEQHNRISSMQEKLKRYDVHKWAELYIDSLKDIKEQQSKILVNRLSESSINQLLKDFNRSAHRLIFLDYDGTLVPFSRTPEDARPDEELIDILKLLTNDPRNEVVIISGRKMETLNKWFGHLKLSLVAEHGAYLKQENSEITPIDTFDDSWKDEIEPIMIQYVDRTPGARIERKSFSLAWHYRLCDPEFAAIRSRELVTTLSYLTSNLDLQVLEGNKVIEVKNAGVNKGRTALMWINKDHDEPSFIMAIGDDWTDEDLFKVLPLEAYSIKVGLNPSTAKYNIKSPEQVRELLRSLTS
ncbi:bifunctional alpha,alpha-trehalose-phosphate synthase (UDP-forming)/trehalose-phosphatase [candidate division KSB1 bacterium]|nr:bifunctional alpha,alpha-trehalose-phosphate synthase (UDP-forming)/trehalose-phosphatase [candidate division KSB1 bacterium]